MSKIRSMAGGGHAPCQRRRYIQHIHLFEQEQTMAKGEQRSNKMVKKPKKDTSVPPVNSSESTRPIAPTTTVMPKGKLKNK